MEEVSPYVILVTHVFLGVKGEDWNYIEDLEEWWQVELEMILNPNGSLCRVAPKRLVY